MASSSSSNQDPVHRRLNRYRPLDDNDTTKQFIREFYKQLVGLGRNHLVEDVSPCTDEQLRQVVSNIQTCILAPLKTEGGRTPVTPSPRPGREDSTEAFRGQSIESQTRSDQGRLRINCLERDGHRCVITGTWDDDYENRPAGEDSAPLQAAHIIPFALGSFNPQDRSSVDRYAEIWTTLRRYFPALLNMSNNLRGINAERNILTLEANTHKNFGQFRFILEPTRTAHRYQIRTFPKLSQIVTNRLPRNRLITFRVQGGDHPRPDPELLKVHAAIGKFLHASGQGEALDKILKDLEDGGGLASDGTTNIGEILSLSSLSLRSSNVTRTTPDSGKEYKQRPTDKHGHVRAKSSDTENLKPRRL